MFAEKLSDLDRAVFQPHPTTQKRKTELIFPHSELAACLVLRRAGFLSSSHATRIDPIHALRTSEPDFGSERQQQRESSKKLS